MSTDSSGTEEINEFQLIDDVYAKGTVMLPEMRYEIYIVVDTARARRGNEAPSRGGRSSIHLAVPWVYASKCGRDPGRG